MTTAMWRPTANHCHITPSPSATFGIDNNMQQWPCEDPLPTTATSPPHPLPPLVLTTTHDNGHVKTMETGRWQWYNVAAMWAKWHQPLPHTMTSSPANHCHVTPRPLPPLAMTTWLNNNNNLWKWPQDDNGEGQMNEGYPHCSTRLSSIRQ